ncbi:Hypothetical protein EUBREC_0468 [Agathobacter rectalis ATCC 33656]|uniref:Uncharacterized protein n=1 Tax=Agathobacter rectalis (strain ATCC 33656 / DSM 3377 / JCM 17463 / KCTC 5835 / VPI 0990) TaxID=515619 RepID=C4ZBW9_AGARV|nr:Hypothetical protein EUBREC_0468 [Agathobacter rectalis ATCC 33656]
MADFIIKKSRLSGFIAQTVGSYLLYFMWLFHLSVSHITRS